MNKTSKGALAAGAAAVLLLGGAGSLAYWSASDTVNGGEITAGTLTLDAQSCDGWTYADGAASEGDNVDLFVPGDVVTNTCTFLVGATGDKLSAEISTTDAAFTAGATSLKLVPDTTYRIAGGVAAERGFEDGETISSDDDGATITATIVVDIPFGTDNVAPNGNDMQGVKNALSDIAVTLTQLDPNP